MAADPTAFELELAAEPASVSAARRQMVDFARGRVTDLDGVAIAISEAVGNAVVHAYRGEANGPIAIHAQLEENDLVITVTDSGVGMRPNPESPGLGLGLPLIAGVASGIEIEPGESGGTRLVIRFPR